MEISLEQGQSRGTGRNRTLDDLRPDRVMANNNRPTEQGKVFPKFNILWY
jgi:hypothetical protein